MTLMFSTKESSLELGVFCRLLPGKGCRVGEAFGSPGRRLGDFRFFAEATKLEKARLMDFSLTNSSLSGIFSTKIIILNK